MTLAVVFSLIFFFGAIFIRNYHPEVTLENTFNAIYAIVVGAMMAGNNSYFLPDIASAKQAAAHLF